MQVRYTTKFRDLLAFCFHDYPRSPFVIGIYGIVFLLISFYIAQSLPPDANPLPKAILFLVAELITFISIAALFLILTTLNLISFRNKTLLTDHALTLDDDTFALETPFHRTEHRWLGVQKLTRTRRHLFIYLSQHSALVIPRRAFKDRNEWDSFYESCKNRAHSV